MSVDEALEIHILSGLESLAASARMAERHYQRQPSLDRAIQAFKDLQQVGGGTFAMQMLAHKAGLRSERIAYTCAALRANVNQSLGLVFAGLSLGEGHDTR